jgi:cytoskeleton protein RodZ
MDNISLGVMLTDLREQMGLTQDDIANKIHVRKTVVADIEKDQLPHAPLVFVKGYIRSYADIVGLPNDEYQPYLDALAKQYLLKESFKFESAENKKSHSKTILFIALFMLAGLLGIGLYYANGQTQNNYVEVSHYVSPGSSDHINS